MLAIARAAVLHRWEEKLNARIAAVISNRQDARGLQLAADMGLTTQVVDHTAFADRADPRTAFDDVLRQTIDSFEPSLVVKSSKLRPIAVSFPVPLRTRAGIDTGVAPSPPLRPRAVQQQQGKSRPSYSCMRFTGQLARSAPPHKDRTARRGAYPTI